MSEAGMSGALRRLGWVAELAPRFPVQGSQVRLLPGPAEYFSQLQDLIGTSQRRVVLASLYLGTGPLEAQLVRSLEQSLKREGARPEFRAVVLLDHSRARRGLVSSLSMLRRLLPKAAAHLPQPGKIQLYLYHTPRLRGFLKWLLPERWDEVIGVQHMKIGVFDDTVLLTGANLSESYFTNRQDRYVVIENCPELADFYEELVQGVAKNSFRVSADASGSPSIEDEHLAAHPFKDPQSKFASHMRSDLEAVVEKFRDRMNCSDSTADTHVYPTIQAGPVGIGQEDAILRRLLSGEASGGVGRIDLASGYFNLTRPYADLLHQRAAEGTRIDVLCAAPSANGFWGGAGISGFIPAIYVQLARDFFNEGRRLGGLSSVRLWEWARGGWTFHGKGLWLGLRGRDASVPSAALLGSSNFGHRSAARDLETQVLVVTESGELRSRLAAERSALFEDNASVVEEVTFQRPDHAVPFWVRLVSRFFRNLF